MSKEKDFSEFLDILLKATERIEPHYFQLPVAGHASPIYRERVYCYELYHRIRELMPSGYRYVLDGEVDKAGHPIIKGDQKPDLIVHVPGEMHRNLALVEVKPITASINAICEDVQKLREFCTRVGYFKGISLVYGEPEPPWMKDTCCEISHDPNRSILLIWHRKPMEQAVEMGQVR